MSEAEKEFTLEDLRNYALIVLGDEDTATYWLNTPKKALGGKVPMRVVETNEGVESVRALLWRIEHGVFS